MRWGIWIALLLFVGSLINAAVIRSIAPSATTPDFLLILTVLLALYRWTTLGLVGAFFLGILVDFASGQFIGAHAAGCVVAFCSVGVIANRMYAEKWPAVMIIVLLCSLLKSSVYLGMVSMYFPNRLGDQFVWIMIKEALFSAIFAPIIFRLAQQQAVPTTSIGTSMYLKQPSQRAFRKFSLGIRGDS